MWTHVNRLRQNPSRNDVLERLLERVDKHNENANSWKGSKCWLFNGPTVGKLHWGVFNMGKHFYKRGKYYQTAAHRAMWILVYGDISDPMLHVCHHCDVPLCVNPKHLFLGTAQDDANDKVSKGRQHKGKDHYIHRNEHHRNRFKDVLKAHPEYRPRGEANGSAKLTEIGVANARKQYDNGVTVAQLARDYNVSYMVMKKAVRRLTWKHVA